MATQIALATVGGIGVICGRLSIGKGLSMKKCCFAAVCAVLVAAVLGAQEGGVSFSTDYVLRNFPGTSIDEDGDFRGAARYTRGVSIEERQLFGGLDDNHTVNTASELLAMASVLGIQDVKKEDALKLYAEIAMEGSANSFLGKTGTTHGQVLERLKAKYHFTNTEINSAIGAAVAAVVDAEFGQIYFTLDHKYDVTLSYNSKTKGYSLRYTNVNDVTKEILASSLNDLRAKMTASRDFTADGVNITVNRQAELIPSAVYANWKQKGVTKGVDAIAVVKEAVTSFFLEPASENYAKLTGIYARYCSNRSLFNTEDFYWKASTSFMGSLLALSEQLRDSVSSSVERNGNYAALASIPNDPAYDVFSIQLANGGK
jgi:hypothetical protein